VAKSYWSTHNQRVEEWRLDSSSCLVHFKLGGGAYVQPLEAGASSDMGCVGPSRVSLWETHRIRDFRS
jgi:hypothetical protein